MQKPSVNVKHVVGQPQLSEIVQALVAEIYFCFVIPAMKSLRTSPASRLTQGVNDCRKLAN